MMATAGLSCPGDSFFLPPLQLGEVFWTKSLCVRNQRRNYGDNAEYRRSMASKDSRTQPDFDHQPRVEVKQQFMVSFEFA